MQWKSPSRLIVPGRWKVRAVGAALALSCPAAASAACAIVTPNAITVGATASTSFSPSSIKGSVVPLAAAKASSGYGCSSTGLITLLGTSYLKATLASGTILSLTSTTTSDTITYKLYADEAATTELKAGIAASYIDGATSLLTLGSGAVDVPIYYKFASTTYAAPGIYKGSFVVRWDWYFCSLLGVGTLCVGTVDSGSNKLVTVNVTVNVAAKPPTIDVDPGTAIWNPVEGTSNPKAIPGSKRRMKVTITNPDYAAVEANTLNIELPTPSGLAIALDGDGSGGAVMQTTDGTPASGLTLSFVSGASTTDNVDFSTNAGSNWTAYPTAGDATSQNAVNRIRLRPQGSMAGLSSYVITIPYSVK